MPFLDWVNKSQATRTAQNVPYHLLRQVSAHGVVDGRFADNLLIQGDNLLALKALLPFYRGQVKCIFIDPPYNTQSAFEHYDDRLEHSQWLSMMYPRLVLLRELLRPDGFIIFHIDDSESHYAKLVLDEIFGRTNYQTTFFIQVRYTLKTLKADMAYHKQIEQAHIYRYSSDSKPNRPVVQTEGFEKFNFEILTREKGSNVYRGSYHFTKHYYGEHLIHDLLERTATGKLKEEFLCAQAIDTCPQVKHWIRNIPKQEKSSFWLPTSTDYFYPDFVAELIDGRLLVIEYKGADRWSDDDSKEKRLIGRKWQDESQGKCLFLMAREKDDFGRDVAGQIAKVVTI